MEVRLHRPHGNANPDGFDFEAWMLERTKYSDGLAAIYPSMMYVIMALDVLGYPQDHPDVIEALAQDTIAHWSGIGGAIINPSADPELRALEQEALQRSNEGFGQDQGQKARDELRRQVGALAVSGAEQIIGREIDAGTHAQLLDKLAAGM